VASLYIKDPETAAMAERLSRRLGTSKTDAVRRALAAMERAMPDRPSTGALLAKLDHWRAAHPLPPEAGPKADKAYFDRMWDDAD
jgi:antitoxin VapB